MTEVYTQVGTDPSWIVAFMPLPAIIAVRVSMKARGAKVRVPWQFIVVLVYFFVASIAAIPMEWILCGACVGAAVGLACTRSVPIPLPARLLLPIAFAGIGYYYTTIPKVYPLTITLQDHQVEFKESHGSGVAPRAGLRIDYIQHSAELNIRPWASWSSETRGPKMVRGANFAGFTMFWGPHGLIRGDDLGKHMAEWAGVKPQDIQILSSKSH